ncbi:MAG: DUF2279 domain-containing protein [Deltaproteobacteria bacterium]|nr:DUF2279 domain-containing protein [Deltaproteobacteria bacterium]
MQHAGVEPAVAAVAPAATPTPTEWRPNESTDFRYGEAARRPPTRAHQMVSLGSITTFWSAVGLWTYFAWYGNQTKAPFAFSHEGWFGGDTYAGGADKLGHMFGSYVAVRATAQELQRGGVSSGASAALASIGALAFFVGIEVKDGYHRSFGFSGGDMVADLVGIGLANLFLLNPRVDELLDLRMQYWPSREYRSRLLRGDIDTLEDYTGMEFGLWLHLGSLALVKQRPHFEVLRYVDLGIGYATDNFKPTPTDPDAIRVRRPYLGVGLNVAAFVDALVFERGQRQGLPRDTALRLLEFYSVPSTYVRLGPRFESER